MAENNEKQARAVARYLRVSPRKTRLVIDQIRGKSLGEALSILALTPNKAAYVTEKVVRSAMANAEVNHDMDPEKLYIDTIYADEGPMLKRARAGAQGRVKPIRHRTTHITVILKEEPEEPEEQEA